MAFFGCICKEFANKTSWRPLLFTTNMVSSSITYAPVHINDFRSVRARYVKRTCWRSSDRNAQVNGHYDTALFISMGDTTMMQPLRPFVATTANTWKQMGTNSKIVSSSFINLYDTNCRINFQIWNENWYIFNRLNEYTLCISNKHA